jgi:phosphatidylglycerol:prolipoprotein diacylglycerol transferase
LRDRFRFGILFAIYLVYAGTERFLVEFLRTNETGLLGLTEAQFLSLAMIVAGLTWILTIYRREGTLARPAEQQLPPA